MSFTNVQIEIYDLLNQSTCELLEKNLILWLKHKQFDDLLVYYFSTGEIITFNIDSSFSKKINETKLKTSIQLFFNKMDINFNMLEN